jgi:hypothetical protein
MDRAIRDFDHYLKYDKTKCLEMIRYYKRQAELLKLNNYQYKQAIDIVNALEKRL